MRLLINIFFELLPRPSVTSAMHVCHYSRQSQYAKIAKWIYSC
jgi:hypothetical protein